MPYFQPSKYLPCFHCYGFQMICSVLSQQPRIAPLAQSWIAHCVAPVIVSLPIALLRVASLSLIIAMLLLPFEPMNCSDHLLLHSPLCTLVIVIFCPWYICWPSTEVELVKSSVTDIPLTSVPCLPFLSIMINPDTKANTKKSNFHEEMRHTRLRYICIN